DPAERIFDLLKVGAVGIRGGGPWGHLHLAIAGPFAGTRWSSGTNTATSMGWVLVERRSRPRVPVNAAVGNLGMGTLCSTRANPSSKKDRSTDLSFATRSRLGWV